MAATGSVVLTDAEAQRRFAAFTKQIPFDSLDWWRGAVDRHCHARHPVFTATSLAAAVERQTSPRTPLGCHRVLYRIINRIDESEAKQLVLWEELSKQAAAALGQTPGECRARTGSKGDDDSQGIIGAVLGFFWLLLGGAGGFVVQEEDHVADLPGVAQDELIVHLPALLQLSGRLRDAIAEVSSGDSSEPTVILLSGPRRPDANGQHGLVRLQDLVEQPEGPLCRQLAAAIAGDLPALYTLHGDTLTDWMQCAPPCAQEDAPAAAAAAAGGAGGGTGRASSTLRLLAPALAVLATKGDVSIRRLPGCGLALLASPNDLAELEPAEQASALDTLWAHCHALTRVRLHLELNDDHLRRVMRSARPLRDQLRRGAVSMTLRQRARSLLIQARQARGAQLRLNRLLDAILQARTQHQVVEVIQGATEHLQRTQLDSEEVAETLEAADEAVQGVDDIGEALGAGSCVDGDDEELEAELEALERGHLPQAVPQEGAGARQELPRGATPAHPTEAEGEIADVAPQLTALSLRSIPAVPGPTEAGTAVTAATGATPPSLLVAEGL